MYAQRPLRSILAMLLVLLMPTVVLGSGGRDEPPAPDLLKNAKRITSVSASKDDSKLRFTLHRTLPIPYLVAAYDFSPDGKWLATCGHILDASNRITRTKCTIWDGQTYQQRKTLSFGKEALKGIRFSPDSRWLAIASVDKVALLHTETWQTAHHFPRPTNGFISQVRFSPDSRYLGMASLPVPAASSAANAPQQPYFMGVSLWDVTAGKQVYALPITASDLVFSPNGSLLVTGGEEIGLWEAATSRKVRQIPLLRRGRVGTLTFTADGLSIVATSNTDSTLYLWDMQTGKLKKKLVGHNGQVVSMSSQKPDLILSGSTIFEGENPSGKTRTGEMALWDSRAGKLVAKRKIEEAGVKQVSFVPNSTLVAVAVGKSIVLWFYKR